MGVVDKLKHAWNAFQQPNLETTQQFNYGAASFSVRQDGPRLSFSNERSIISSIYTRLAVDVSGVAIRHVRLDDEDRYLSDIPSGLNNCLKVEANLDQAARAFRQDLMFTLLDKGVAVIVPVDTTINPVTSGGYDILTTRIGEVTAWFPRHVRVNVYDVNAGVRKEITLPKTNVAIIYNPFYEVMNGQSSTLKRLIRKLNLLDIVDEQISSGKLDMIIQLPYLVKTESKRQAAEQRRKDLEFQLAGSKYGIAYIDGTEKITQLNRPVENNLLTQVEYLMKLLYSQLGMTEDVMNGMADEKAMLNYTNRTVVPFLDAIVESMRRSFLTKTARSQQQSIKYFQDPFKFVPMEQLAEITDKFTRNEVLSSNEIRQVIGFKPSNDPKADQLRNSNMPAPSELAPIPQEGDGQNDSSAQV